MVKQKKQEFFFSFHFYIVMLSDNVNTVNTDLFSGCHSPLYNH